MGGDVFRYNACPVTVGFDGDDGGGDEVGGVIGSF